MALFSLLSVSWPCVRERFPLPVRPVPPFSLDLADPAGSGLQKFLRDGLGVALRVDAQQRFGPGGAKHQPAIVAEVELDAVEGLSMADRPASELLEMLLLQRCQNALLASVFEFNIGALVKMRPELPVQIFDQLGQTASVPGHHFGQQQCADGGIAFGQVKGESDAATLLAPDEDVALEHQRTDVLEADRRFVHPAPV